MSLFKKLFRFIREESADSDVDSWIARQPKIKVTFHRITDVGLPPDNDTIKEGEFYRVIHNEKPKWGLFLCPCGCSSVITLSLQDVHRPHWRVRLSKKGRPTMRPSVWRDVGCMSHFWINDGRIYWCSDTGSEPWMHY